MSDQTFWIVGQVGILMELAGALYIAVSAIVAHKRIGRLFFDFLGFREVPRIIETIANQTKTDITGFTLLASGLLLQFVGNFGSVPT